MSDKPSSEKEENVQAAGTARRSANKAPESSSASTNTASLHIPDHQLVRCIGRGAYGEVWLARSIMGTYRAVKILWRKTFETDRPFEREFAGIQNFEPVSRSHEALVDILHVGRNDAAGYFFYVMELADDVQTGAAIDPDRYEARTLQREIQERGRLPVQECLRVGLSLTSGLGYLHDHGLVHRDIKSSNIIFVKGVPKLADIGLVLVCGTDGSQSHVGTDGYIPPEGAGTPQADIYSLGKVLFEMGTGKSRDHFPDLLTDLRENGERAALVEFNEVLLKACTRDVRQRYQSAHDLEADLALLEMGRSLRTKRRNQKHWTRTILVAGVAATIALGSLLLWVMKRSQHQTEAEAYLQKATFLAERSSGHQEGEQNNPRVIDLLEKAVALDPALGKAHADLALAYTLRLFTYAPEEKHLQEKAYLSVERALSLDPKLPTAYLARGRLNWTPSHHFAHAKAMDDIAHALELDPKLSEAHQIRGQINIHVGLLDEAMQDFAEAIALNPGNNAAHFRIGEAYVFKCEFQNALNKLETIDPDFIPDFRVALMCIALIGLGHIEDARRILEAHPTDSGGLIASVDAMVHALFQRQPEAEHAIRRAATKRGFGHFHHTLYQIACAYALMDQKDLAIVYLTKSAAAGFNCYPLFERDSNLANLRSDPRFIDFLAEEKKHHDLVKAEYGVKAPRSIPATRERRK